MLRRISHVLIFKVLGAGLTFLVQVLLARLLGVADYGVVTFLLTLLGFATLLAKFGFDNTCMRLVSEYRAAQNWALLIGLVIVAASTVAVFGLLIAVGIGYLGTSTTLFPEAYRPYTPLLLGLLPLLPLQNVAASMVRGLGAQAAAEVSETAFRQMMLLACLMLLVFWRGGASVEAVIGVYLFATVAAVGLAVLMMYWHRPPEFQVVAPRLRLPEWFSTTSALLLTGGLYLLMSQVDILMLGWLTRPEDVAVYSVASRITGLLSMGLAAAMIVVAPKIAELHGRSASRDEIQGQLDRTARFILIYIVISSVALVILGQPILHFFGEGFIAAYVPMVILIMSRVAEATAGPVGQLLAMMGKHWLVGRVLILPAATNIVLNLVLIPRLGVNGAALATLISTVLWNGILVYFAWSRFGLDPTLRAGLRARTDFS